MNSDVVLFRLLPKARVVYCSATGVTDVKNMVSPGPVQMSLTILHSAAVIGPGCLTHLQVSDV